jgi:hypothetical protein
LNEEAEGNSNDNGEENSDDSGRPAGPSLGQQVLRVFLCSFLAAFLVGLTFADDIALGLRVDYDTYGAFQLGVITGVIAALIRLLVAMLPLFPDDRVGFKRKS